MFYFFRALELLKKSIASAKNTCLESSFRLTDE